MSYRLFIARSWFQWWSFLFFVVFDTIVIEIVFLWYIKQNSYYHARAWVMKTFPYHTPCRWTKINNQNWFLIAWQHSRPPIRYHVGNSPCQKISMLENLRVTCISFFLTTDFVNVTNAFQFYRIYLVNSDHIYNEIVNLDMSSQPSE